MPAPPAAPSSASATATAPTVTLTAAMPSRSATRSPHCPNDNAPRWCSATCLGLSAPETADHMGLTPDAVRSLTKRATATLRDQLGEHTPIGTREVRDA